MLWAAACTPAPPTEAAALQALTHWALQFTPRVAQVEEAVLLELRASLRLFGGAAALRARVAAEAPQLGASALSWGAPTGLAALALARAGRGGCALDDGEGAAALESGPAPACALLDALPLEVLSAARAHVPTLLRSGCATLGALRQLPRAGVARRFGAELLQALDQAYGLRPEGWCWVVPAERFELGLELPWRVEQAAALAQGAHRLLLALCGWLAARQGGATAFTLRWAHDAMRSRSAGAGGELTVRTAEPTRDVAFLHRLLSEHLHRAVLQAPVGALALALLEWRALAPASAELLPAAPGSAATGEPLGQVLERLSARLGVEQVRRPLLLADHRPEWMQRWLGVHEALPRAAEAAPVPAWALPQPGFVLAQPLRLATQGDRPLYQGPLQLLAGPHRIEGGWWHRLAGAAGAERSGHVQRDYWLAWSAHAGLLWIFQTRLADDATAWYLHGSFA